MTETNAQDKPVRPADGLNWADKYRFQRQFREQAARSYLVLSFGTGLIAAMLPILLILTGEYRQHMSISHFYYGNDAARNIMVGSLCGTAVFLLLFQGLSKLENWLLNLAGIAAIAVAFVPMGAEQCARVNSIHEGSAVVFFLCLSVVAIFLSKERIRFIIYPPLKQRFSAAYTACGLAMFAMPGLVLVASKFAPHACQHHYVFWAETFGIWAFSAYWFIKTYEYAMLLGIRGKSPPKRLPRLP